MKPDKWSANGDKMRKCKQIASLWMIFLILAACSSAPQSTPAPQAPTAAARFNENQVVGEYGGSSNFSLSLSSSLASDVAAQEMLDQVAERIIIRNAFISVDSKDALGLYQSIAQLGESLGGYEFSYSLSNYTTFRQINAVYKVPPEHLTTLIDYITANSEVQSSSLQSDDVTDNYYDAETRLDTKRRSLEQYYLLLHEATSVDEIVQIQRTIDNITEEIEALEGRLRMWQRLADMATVTLTIRQNEDGVSSRREISWNTLSLDDMAYLIKRGFVTVLNNVISILQWIVIAVIGYAPLWLVFAAIVYLGFLLRNYFRKRRARNREK